MSYSSEVLADSPLVYWRLGDPSGTTMTDSSGSARDGTYVNSPTLGATGLVSGDSDTAVTFDGTNDYGHIADAAWMDVSAISLEAIIKLGATGAYQNIIDRDNGTTQRMFQFRVSNTNKLECILWRSGDGPFTLTGSTSLSSGTTYHCAMAYDGGATSWKLYLNGAQDASSALGGTHKTGAYNVVVGASSSGGTLGAIQRFTGTIDEVAYYGTGLSASRINAHAVAAGLATAPAQRRFLSPTALRRQAVVRAAHL